MLPIDIDGDLNPRGGLDVLDRAERLGAEGATVPTIGAAERAPGGGVGRVPTEATGTIEIPAADLREGTGTVAGSGADHVLSFLYL